MALTQQEKQIVEYGLKSGKTALEVKSAIAKYRAETPKSIQKKTDTDATTGSVLGRVISDIPEDVGRGVVGNAINQFGQAGENIIDTATDENLTLGQKARGIGAEAFRRGGRFIGGVLGTAIKLPFTQEFEQQVGEQAMEIGQDIASTDIAQDLMQTYTNLDPETKREVDNILGFTEGLAEIGTAGLVSRVTKPVLNQALNVAKRGVSGAGTLTRGFTDSLGNVYNSTGGLVRPATDIVTGIGRQAGQFAKRTANQAIDTAETARRLSELPAPQANLIRSGADERVVNIIGQSNPQEINVIKELSQQARKKELDPTPNTSQPKEIAGREFLKPVEHLIKQRDTIGSSLGELRKNLNKTETVNTNPFVENFNRYLTEDLGLVIDDKGKIKSGVGRIAQSDVREIQKIYTELNSKTSMSEKEIDEFLQRTFKEYDLRQAREKTFGDDVTRVAERARNEIRKAMPEEYNELSTQYAEILKPIQNTVKLLGYKGRIDDLTTKELKAGEVALRVLGNAADRPQSTINEVLDIAEKYGYTSDVDLNKILYITDQLEDLYNITPTRGFSGSTARGIDQTAIGAVGDVATMNLGGLFNRAMGSQATKEEVKEAFEAFLQSLGENTQ